MTLRRLNERFFQDITLATWTFPRLFKNVIRHAGIGTCDFVEHNVRLDRYLEGIPESRFLRLAS